MSKRGLYLHLKPLLLVLLLKTVEYFVHILEIALYSTYVINLIILAVIVSPVFSDIFFLFQIPFLISLCWFKKH